MFILQSENQEFALKPMNCPSHCLIFKNDFRTYKDLPWRVADFGALHRNELSGALSGLTRVRKFCQDDCHIFAKLEDIESEIDGLLQFVDYVYGQVFKIPYEINLSTRPEKYLGTIEMWDGAEKSLMKALDRNKQQYKLNPGDGAFYGPKLDFRIKDCLGRMHQTATIQLDFNLPIRFELEYEGADGKRHRPVMIHRAMLGSVERFMAVMTEHFEGKFPLWLSPVQVEIVSVADRHIDYAKQIEKELFAKEFRVETRFDAQTVANKIRLSLIEDKPNYMIIVGDENISKNTISVRTRKFENGKNEEFETTLPEFIKRLEEERKTRSIYF
jgi:threonyl-tRNA synthetase